MAHATPVTVVLWALPRQAISPKSLALSIVRLPPVLPPPQQARYWLEKSKLKADIEQGPTNRKDKGGR